jgi:hypothetical protein
MKKIGALMIIASALLFLATFIIPGIGSIVNISLNLLILGFVLFLIGFIKEKADEINFPPTFYKIIFWARKLLGFLILADLLWVIINTGLLGFYLWFMFFNVAIIFCLILLLTKNNGLLVGIILLLSGLFYCFIPLLPGPVLGMPLPTENQSLFIWIFTAKWLILISSVFIFISGFFNLQKN